jgi:ubiquinol-cytochrome c reductase iron-sulfur subunit
MSREAIVATLLAATAVASVAFAFAYAFGSQTQLCAALLAIAFGTLAAGMVVWEHELMPHPLQIEDRGSLPSGGDKDDAVARSFFVGAERAVGTRGWLVKLFAGAAGALGIAVLVPLRSCAPANVSPGDVAKTSWRKGSRVVLEDGSLVHAAELDVNSVITVFPQGHTGPEHVDEMANDATVIVRVPPSELRLPADRVAGSPGGLLAFSKVCPHAGCPVALYRAAARQLFCPCHQSTFDVTTGGSRVFGPAARGLPQLPIAIAADGTLEALGDYGEPIGPGFWERA